MSSLFRRKSYSMDDPAKEDVELSKVVVVGAPAVGKTSFLQRLQGLPLSQPRHRDHIRTAECTLTPRPPLRFNVHVLNWNEAMEQRRLECCFSKATTVVFMFSVDDQSSISFLEQWLVNNGHKSRELLLEQAGIITIGNKCGGDGATFPPGLTNAIDALKQNVESIYKQDTSDLAASNIIATVMEPIATEMLTEGNTSRTRSFRVVKMHIYCMNDMYGSPKSSPTSPTFHKK